MRWEEYEEKVNWEEALLQHLTLPYGVNLWFFSSGEVVPLERNTSPINQEDVVAVIPCPGPANMDTSVYEEGFRWEEGKGWIDEITGEFVGDSFKDLIAYLIKEVGLDDEMAFLKEEVRKQFQEKEDK